MDPIKVIEKYYDKQSELYRILVSHSEDVTRLALALSSHHPELGLDNEFIAEAAMLHDIGIFQTYAPDIHCDGAYPYIYHGFLGSKLLRNEGLERHALVAERHTGTGLSLDYIRRLDDEQNFEIPLRDMRPVSMEEQIICFADKFFSKTHLGEERSVAKARVKLEKFGYEGLKQFDAWCKMFL